MKAPPEPGAVIAFGPFTFDKAQGKLTKLGTPVRLSGMPLKILQHLLNRPGEVASRGELQSLLWKDTAFGDFEQGLNTAVNLVRRALGDSADQARYIETVGGQGYRFIAPLLPAGVVNPDTLVETGIRRDPAGWKAKAVSFRWGIAALLALALLGGSAWRTSRSAAQVLTGGAEPSENREANDQYNLAMIILSVQNDIPLALKTIERALELDSHFAAARLQRATLNIINIYNGYANDRRVLIQAEEDLHQAEKQLPGDDGLLLATQAAVYLAQGRLDRIPRAGMEEWWQKHGANGEGSPVWLVIPQMLEGQTKEPMTILRADLERHSLANPTRMFLGEILRTDGDAKSGVQVLERALQQGAHHPTAIWFLAMAYLDLGQPARARALLEGSRPEFETNYQWRHAWAILLAAEGNHKEARQAMDEETLKYAGLTWSVTSATADFYALQGDRTKAIEWLQLAIDRGDERVSYFRRNPRLASLKEDVHFQSLLHSVEARRR